MTNAVIAGLLCLLIGLSILVPLWLYAASEVNVELSRRRHDHEERKYHERD